MVISVPSSFYSYTRVSAEGAAGRAWADRLPALVDSLLRRWRLTLDGDVMHGANGLALPVLRGTLPCLLKVAWVDEELARQVIGLELWSETPGMVRLLDALPASGALLLERLSATTARSLDWAPALEVSGRLLRGLAIPVAADGSLPTVGSLAMPFLDSGARRNSELGSPLLPYEIKQIGGLLEEILGVHCETLLVNYDLHDENILRSLNDSTDSTWVAIDPKVVVGPPEYGLAQLLWWRMDSWQSPAEIMRAFDVLVSAAELDRSLARAWTIVRSADYLLWGLENGLTIDPPRCRRLIDSLLPS